MKRAFLIFVLSALTSGAIHAAPLTSGGGKKHKTTQVKTADKESYIKAVRLINNADGSCTFEYGKIPNKTNIESTGFFAQTHVDAYEKVAHAAPRRQYVVTLKGKLKFKVTNGETFIIEPGVVLIAEDTQGAGHTWDLIKGEKWERLYIPLSGEDHFIKE